jgi:uncharacterized protein
MSPSTATVVGLLVALSACREPSSGASATAPEIVSTGSGEVRVPPDRAEVTIAVETRGRTAALAGRANTERMSLVLAALRRQSLPDSSIATAGYSVSLEDDYRDPPSRSPREYVARNAVEVKVATLTALGAIVDTALAAGATEVANIIWRSSRETEARQRAIALAVTSARMEAEAAAAAAGRTLGRVIEIVVDPSRSAGFGRDVMRLESVIVTGAAVTPMMPSDISARVQVRVRSALSRSRPDA